MQVSTDTSWPDFQIEEVLISNAYLAARPIVIILLHVFSVLLLVGLGCSFCLSRTALIPRYLGHRADWENDDIHGNGDVSCRYAGRSDGRVRFVRAEVPQEVSLCAAVGDGIRCSRTLGMYSLERCCCWAGKRCLEEHRIAA